MFPGYPVSDMRVEIIEGELYIDEIKANQCRIGPLARCINGPHANLYGSSGDFMELHDGWRTPQPRSRTRLGG